VWWGKEIKGIECRPAIDLPPVSAEYTLVKELSHAEIVESLKKKLKDFFNSTHLPTLATKWREVAMKTGAGSERCQKIAELHAISVDEFSTGIMVPEDKYNEVMGIKVQDEEELQICSSFKEQTKKFREKIDKQFENTIFTHDKELINLYNEENKKFLEEDKKKKALWKKVKSHVAKQLTEYNRSIQLRYGEYKKDSEEQLQNFKVNVEHFKLANEDFLKEIGMKTTMDRMFWRQQMAVIAYYQLIQKQLKKESIQQDKNENKLKPSDGMSYVYIVFDTQLCSLRAELSALEDQSLREK